MQIRPGGKLAAGALIAASGFLVPVAQASAATVHPAAVTVNRTWDVTENDGGAPIAQSSPTLVDLGGAPAAVVGDRGGHIYAVHLSDGSEVPGWPATVPAGVDSTPSTDGSNVYVGVGLQSASSSGGYESLSANGARRWYTTVVQQPGQTTGQSAVTAGLTVADLQGQTDVTGPSLGQFSDALNAANGATLGGWPFFQADSNAATSAVADLYSNGQEEVVEGGDSTAGVAEGTTYVNGGHVRVVSSRGALVCNYNTSQIVRSSPAVGQFLGGGAVGITVGTNTPGYSGASQTNQLLGLNSRCGLQWATTLDGATPGSPALVDAVGNGALQIAEGTTRADNLSGGGSVYLINGTNGSVIWRADALGAVIGSPVSVDLGGGYQDLVVASLGGLQILDGKTGATVWSANNGLGYQNSPLVTDDPNGSVGITVAGYNGSGQGEITHYEVAGSDGGRVGEAGSWSQFHHDAQLTGDAGTPPPPPPCKPPAGGPAGYWLGATDGGIFSFGNLPFCGSTGGITLNKPVVGMAGTRDGGGYWLVASDGGIFTFGDAGYYGSTGGIRLAQPVVGMAPTPDGRGYWLVASDGGIFTFGDAGYYGSTGNVHLNKPIVGMAATPDGRGYWLVASDGGIFTFGDAHFYGSTGGIRLNKPVVGMARSASGNGYWLVATDGGIFTFGDAHFYGSTGGIKLNQPVVATASY